MTNTVQKNAVMKVLPANDHLRPSEDSIKYAPNNAPGQPPMVNITTSHKLCSKVLGVDTPPFEPVSNSFGKNTLNMVYASDIVNQADHIKTVVLSHSGDRIMVTRSHHAESGLLNQLGTMLYAFFSQFEDLREIMDKRRVCTFRRLDSRSNAGVADVIDGEIGRTDGSSFI